jgi:hypothetical protein
MSGTIVAEMANNARRDLGIRLAVMEAIMQAALATVRRAILERFPPGPDRRMWLRWHKNDGADPGREDGAIRGRSTVVNQRSRGKTLWSCYGVVIFTRSAACSDETAASSAGGAKR